MTERMTSRRAVLRGAAGSLIGVSAGPVLAPGGAQAAETGPAPRADRRGGNAGFAHPGLLHSAADLERMRRAVAAEEAPIRQGFEAMAADWRSAHDYSIRNTGQITTWGRGPTDHKSEAERDSAAAYQNALMWAITGDVRHADKARDILDAWSASLRGITGADGQLGAGLQGFKFVNAAELLRHSDYDGWSEAGIARCERSFNDVWYPSVSGYALFANGNWDTAALQTIMAIAVFSDDRAMFEDAVRYAAGGAGNGTVTNIVVDDAGQGQESGRSQSYAQLGIGLLADAAEVAWNQGVDLYGLAGDRILAGYEYIARYNLGGEVPFETDLDRTGKYLKTEISDDNFGRFRPVQEMAYGHYAGRRGLAAPDLERAIFRDGGERHIEGYNDDYPSWGTLTFARPPAEPTAPPAPPAAPAGLASESSDAGVTVSWVASIEATSGAEAESYTVRRAGRDGDFETVATGLTSTVYTDGKTRPGRYYVYTVSAVNDAGESPDSPGIAVTAGLPVPWKADDIGEPLPGRTEFDGRRFAVTAGGSDIAGGSDRFRFTHLPMWGDGSLTARIVGPVSSQYAKVGVMMRESLDADSAHAAMLVQGLPLHAWSGVWTTRATAGAETVGTGGTTVPPTQLEAITVGAGFPIAAHGSLPESATPLPAPYVEGASDGYRWRRPYWVRIERSGRTFTGWISPDGRDWTEVGSSQLDLGYDLRVGLAVCSVIDAGGGPGETTTAAFDNVSAPGCRSTDAPDAAVEGLRAWASGSAIELAWSGADASGQYAVKRSKGRGRPRETIATGVEPVGFGVRVRYTDVTGEPGTRYSYAVCAENTAGEGPPSETATAVMPTPPAPEVESRAEAYASEGVPFEYLIRASADPVEFTATGLPEGLSLDAATGIVSGTPVETGEFAVAIGAANATGSSSATLNLTVGAPPPDPWNYRDIGDHVLDERRLGAFGVVSIRTPGITSYDEETASFTVRGAGTDINVINQGMTVHFASVPLTGDGTVIARVQRPELGRAGLIMAKSLSPFDQVAGTILDSGGRAQFFRRPRVAFRPTTTDGDTPGDGPVWLRLERTGTAFGAAVSADGRTWTAIGEPDTIDDFGDALYYAGLAVVSGDPATLSTVAFDHVSISQ
ncbi:alginate lyase family protein [Glycomyces salinus]|uniref:alginate lyase family protein n=1 Tax=Glycomyces salinus TaxID=980294 RepID=UPI0018ED19B8|nr:alginate lyase family protein [Glycomyces salinus]